MASPVLVTGGTGRLGKLVVARLQDSDCDVRVLARHDRPIPQGVTFFTADLRTGQGIEPAVTAAAAIIHCATSTRGDAEATRNLVAAASRTGSAHLVYVSIVGIDHIASWGYPKTKLQAEQIVASSGLPWTILRVTQFYDYCLANAQKLSRFPVAPVPAGFTVQPVDPRDVAGLRRAGTGRARRPRAGHGRTTGEQLDGPAPGVPEGQPSPPMGAAGPDTGHPGSPQRRSAATARTHRRLPDLGPVPHHPTAAASHHNRLARPAGRPPPPAAPSAIPPGITQTAKGAPQCKPE